MVDLKPASGSWSALEPDTGTKRWEGQPRSHDEINTCAPCHSRRRRLPATISRSAVPRRVCAELVGRRRLLRRRPDSRGRLRMGPVPSEQDVSRRRDLFRLSRSSQREAAADTNSLCGKCHSLANFGNEQHHHHKPRAPARCASTVTCRRAPTWRSMSGTTTASACRVPIFRGLWNSQRLQSVSQRQVRPLGRRHGGEVVRSEPQAGSALRRRRSMPAAAGCRTRRRR